LIATNTRLLPFSHLLSRTNELKLSLNHVTEWVDDENVVAPFSRALDAEKAFFNLTAHPLDPTAPLEFHLISAITHESLTELNLTSEAPKPFFVRLAMASDVRAVVSPFFPSS
jgi:hypothetical protein